MSNRKKIAGAEMPLFDNEEAANEAVEGFCNELYDLRQKYGIHNMRTIFVPLVRGSDEIGNPAAVACCATQSLGSDTELLLMTAKVYGDMRQRFAAMLQKAQAGTSKVEDA